MTDEKEMRTEEMEELGQQAFEEQLDEQLSEAAAQEGYKGVRLTRRNFMQIGLGILSGLAVLEIGGISLLYLRPRKRTEEFSGVIEAGPVEEFPPGSVTGFQRGNFYLIRSQEGGFLAVYRRCPHLGCSVNYDPDHEGFLCPCHASSFDFHGDYQSPPVPRALDTFAVTIEDGLVMVDTSRKQRGEHYAPEQLVHHVESL